MWTSKNRARYDRSKLRYPSDLTDDEWGLVEPLIPPGSGARSRKTFRREARSTTTSICGHMTARWNESTTRSMNSVANEIGGKLVRPPPSSIARA